MQEPSWLQWFVVALPVACLGNLVCWGLLLSIYRPGVALKEVRRLPDTSVRVLSPIRVVTLSPLMHALTTSGIGCCNNTQSCVHRQVRA